MKKTTKKKTFPARPVVTGVRFDCSDADFKLVRQIVDKAVERYPADINDRTGLEMDIIATHMNGTPLRLADFLAFDEGNFGHDLFGIQANIDRRTGKLKNCFLPRAYDSVAAKSRTGKRAPAGIITAVFLAMFLCTGCETIKNKLFDMDNNADLLENYPIETDIVRDLFPAGNVSLTPSPRPFSASGYIRAFIKNADYRVSTPGAWYEVDVKYSFDVSISTEYVVVDLLSKTAQVYNQNAAPPRAIVLKHVPPGAYDGGRPGA